MDINECRGKINEVDDEILSLFLQRMALAGEVARYKQQSGLAVLNESREREILARVSEKAGPEFERSARILFSNLFGLSRSHQQRLLFTETPLTQKIREALAIAPKLFPDTGVVACQGVEGAYSQLACDKLFSFASIVYFKNFDGVFQAVEQGLCEFGVLPIDNSSYGSVTAVYDLMKNYNFHIARSIKVKVDHTLLAMQGAKFDDIREIYSHEHALGQCSNFLKQHSDIIVHMCENTAVAAQRVAELNRPDVAAISSRQCAELYGLSVLQDGFQNSEHNYTRFICISKDLRVYPGANRISLILAAPHKPGSLQAIISKFSVLGLNLTKLESRPIIGQDFQFMFYFDFDASLQRDDVIRLLGELSSGPELFIFLGNYSEV